MDFGVSFVSYDRGTNVDRHPHTNALGSAPIRWTGYPIPLHNWLTNRLLLGSAIFALARGKQPLAVE
ncbi:hypothetical protein AWC15_03395 [Mycobacterium lacus]|uniref:Uncharacterized protein n=1 Tax=Mycobacterium lacus TaxID=169765 RepID=A0A1X1Y056_9MYCO|nr:hypothetical protein AWC15_03395 [Mycobacterium lacus]BBX98170.1 hypothetical protein MLAC_34640 [Mycobacterium lacus]